MPLHRGVLVALDHRGGGSCTLPPEASLSRKSVGRSSPLSWERHQEPLLPFWQVLSSLHWHWTTLWLGGGSRMPVGS